jgi:hypothetical protein
MPRCTPSLRAMTTWTIRPPHTADSNKLKMTSGATILNTSTPSNICFFCGDLSESVFSH